MTDKISIDLYKVPYDLKMDLDPFILVRSNDLERLKELLKLKPSLLMKVHGFAGYTLLHRAAELGHTEICELLILAGIPPNCKSIRSWNTPLHLALGYGHMDTSRLLLSMGAISLLNKNQESPFDFAKKKGFELEARELEYTIDKKMVEANINRNLDRLTITGKGPN